MKKIFVLGMALLMVIGFAGVSMAKISDSGAKHNFVGDGDFGNPTSVCEVCHTPHGAVNAGSSPLWSHTMSTATSYTMYSNSNGTLDTTTIGTQPGGVSKLCLSCHDGTVALDAYVGGPGTSSGTKISTSKMIGTVTGGVSDLSDDHPISFSYNTQLVTDDGELVDVSTVTAALPFFGLLNDQLECATCHDVHQTDTAATNANKLLRVDNSGSGLCITCHIK